MTSVMWPLFYNEELLDSESQLAETGNGVYISKTGFADFMPDNTDEFVAIELSFNNKSAFCHIIGTHNGDDEALFAPGWMCNSIGCSGGEDVQIKRVYPSIGTKITIKPQNTRYTEGEDPVEALRNAFESYSCLISGIEIPLLVNGQILNVAILDTVVDGPICIRGVELEVEIAVDPDAISSNIIEEPIVPIQVVEEPIDFSSMLPIPVVQDNRFPGTGRVLGGGNKYRRI